MQRDMDLVRQILLAIEASPDEQIRGQPTIKGWNDQTVSYHLKLLKDAGLIDAEGNTYLGSGFVWHWIGLTWRGHEFLDAARDETVWRKAKSTIGDKVSSVSIAVLQEVLAATMRGMLGLP